jgi:hypothetical protein
MRAGPCGLEYRTANRQALPAWHWLECFLGSARCSVGAQGVECHVLCHGGEVSCRPQGTRLALSETRIQSEVRFQCAGWLPASAPSPRTPIHSAQRAVPMALVTFPFSVWCDASLARIVRRPPAAHADADKCRQAARPLCAAAHGGQRACHLQGRAGRRGGEEGCRPADRKARR